MKYITTADRVVVRPEPVEKKTSSGLIVAKSEFDVLNKGTVVQIGPGRTTKKNITIPVDVSVGDRIIFDGGAGIPVQIDGEKFLILKEEEIIGIEE
jgi:chaperonin GroES